MSLTLKEILKGSQAGDEQAIATLVRRFWDWAIDQIQAFTHDSDLARNAVQETFITALERLSDLRNKQALLVSKNNIQKENSYDKTIQRKRSVKIIARS